MFKFKEKEEESPVKKFQEKYDIFADKDILNSLENEIKQHGDFYKMCEAKGWISIKPRPNEACYDFTVLHNPDDPSCRTAVDFTDYCAREKALSKRQDFFRRKQEEADKQRLFT